MILNAYSIIALFLALVTGTIALALALASVKVYAGWGRGLSGEERSRMENRSTLLLLTAVVILSVKLLSWPLFYLTLQSFVPSIQGAMCIFGVTQARPALGAATQIMKPVVFLMIGSWLLLNRLDRHTDTAPLFRRKFLLLFLVSLVVLIDSTLDLTYLTTLPRNVEVACCTSFFDLPGRTTSLLPVSLFGESYRKGIVPLYYLSNFSLIVLLLVLFKTGLRPDRPGIAATMMGGAMAFSLIHSAVTVTAFFEVIAPAVMKLPLHHCLYCMWQYASRSIGFTALFLLGTLTPSWAFLLGTLGRHAESMDRLGRYLGNLYLGGAAGIGLSMIWVTAELFFPGRAPL